MPVIAGRVLSADGRPLSGATVHIVRAPVNVPELALQTNAAGHFVLGVPAPGTYCIGIRFEGRSLQQEVTVGAGSAECLVTLL